VVAQANLTGAVTSILDNAVNGGLPVFSGTSGKVIKELLGNGVLKLVNGVVVLVPESELAAVPIRKSFVGDGKTRDFEFYTDDVYSDKRTFAEIVSLNGQVLTREEDYTITNEDKVYSIALSSGWFMPTPSDRIEVFAIPIINNG
jgi:hypothetical protein